MNTNINIPLPVKSSINNESCCPYYERPGICGASISYLMISKKELYLCDSEDYDRCPFFISKALRRL